MSKRRWGKTMEVIERWLLPSTSRPRILRQWRRLVWWHRDNFHLAQKCATANFHLRFSYVCWFGDTVDVSKRWLDWRRVTTLWTRLNTSTNCTSGQHSWLGQENIFTDKYSRVVLSSLPPSSSLSHSHYIEIILIFIIMVIVRCSNYVWCLQRMKPDLELALVGKNQPLANANVFFPDKVNLMVEMADWWLILIATSIFDDK